MQAISTQQERMPCRALTEIQHDVKEAREAIQEVVDDDKV